MHRKSVIAKEEVFFGRHEIEIKWGNFISWGSAWLGVMVGR